MPLLINAQPPTWTAKPSTKSQRKLRRSGNAVLSPVKQVTLNKVSEPNAQEMARLTDMGQASSIL